MPGCLRLSNKLFRLLSKAATTAEGCRLAMLFYVNGESPDDEARENIVVWWFWRSLLTSEDETVTAAMLESVFLDSSLEFVLFPISN